MHQNRAALILFKRISARWDDDVSDNPDNVEFVSYRRRLIGYEQDALEPFADAEFDDSTLKWCATEYLG